MTHVGQDDEGDRRRTNCAHLLPLYLGTDPSRGLRMTMWERDGPGRMAKMTERGEAISGGRIL